MSQFNYSRNITFDIDSLLAMTKDLIVAIQLFAEYNFWYWIHLCETTLFKVAIQLFAEYNFWLKLLLNDKELSDMSQFNYSRNITFDWEIETYYGLENPSRNSIIRGI